MCIRDRGERERERETGRQRGRHKIIANDEEMDVMQHLGIGKMVLLVEEVQYQGSAERLCCWTRSLVTAYYALSEF